MKSTNAELKKSHWCNLNVTLFFGLRLEGALPITMWMLRYNQDGQGYLFLGEDQGPLKRSSSGKAGEWSSGTIGIAPESMK